MAVPAAEQRHECTTNQRQTLSLDQVALERPSCQHTNGTSGGGGGRAQSSPQAEETDMKLESYETMGYTLSGLTREELETIATALKAPEWAPPRRKYLAAELDNLLKEIN